MGRSVVLHYPDNIIFYLYFGRTVRPGDWYTALRFQNFINNNKVDLNFIEYSFKYLSDVQRKMVNLKFKQEKSYKDCGEILKIAPYEARKELLSIGPFLKYNKICNFVDAFFMD